MKLLLIAILFSLISCTKIKKGCVLDRTGTFYVENRSDVTAKFILIQNTDTIKQTILPYSRQEYTIKAGVVTESYLYIADTIYRKTIDNWKIQRCAVDGHLIRF